MESILFNAAANFQYLLCLDTAVYLDQDSYSFQQVVYNLAVEERKEDHS